MSEPTASGDDTGAPTNGRTDRFAEQRAALSGLDALPLSEHAEVFAQVHSQLQAALAEIDGI